MPYHRSHTPAQNRQRQIAKNRPLGRLVQYRNRLGKQLNLPTDKAELRAELAKSIAGKHITRIEPVRPKQT